MKRMMHAGIIAFCFFSSSSAFSQRTFLNLFPENPPKPSTSPVTPPNTSGQSGGPSRVENQNDNDRGIVLKKAEEKIEKQVERPEIKKITGHRQYKTSEGPNRDLTCKGIREFIQLRNILVDQSEESIRQYGGVPESSIGPCECTPTEVNHLYLPKKIMVFRCIIHYTYFNNNATDYAPPIPYKGGGTIAR